MVDCWVDVGLFSVAEGRACWERVNNFACQNCSQALHCQNRKQHQGKSCVTHWPNLQMWCFGVFWVVRVSPNGPQGGGHFFFYKNMFKTLLPKLTYVSNKNLKKKMSKNV